MLLELGLAEHDLGHPEARERLKEAAELAHDRDLRADAARRVCWITGPDPRAMEEVVIPLLQRSLADERLDPELVLPLEAPLLAALFLLPSRVEEFTERVRRFEEVPGDTPAECLLLGSAYSAWPATGSHSARVRAARGSPGRPGSPPGGGSESR